MVQKHYVVTGWDTETLCGDCVGYRNTMSRLYGTETTVRHNIVYFRTQRTVIENAKVTY